MGATSSHGAAAAPVVAVGATAAAATASSPVSICRSSSAMARARSEPGPSLCSSSSEYANSMWWRDGVRAGPSPAEAAEEALAERRRRDAERSPRSDVRPWEAARCAEVGLATEEPWPSDAAAVEAWVGSERCRDDTARGRRLAVTLAGAVAATTVSEPATELSWSASAAATTSPIVTPAGSSSRGTLGQPPAAAPASTSMPTLLSNSFASSPVDVCEAAGGGCAAPSSASGATSASPSGVSTRQRASCARSSAADSGSSETNTRPFSTLVL
mmetsp:Transcript_13691/g.43756  ORF Transcript_13691/g.43756 Transcript_13691/m.43756 type:complete len:272 (+) Transcript_13691:1339-2154(+)